MSVEKVIIIGSGPAGWTAAIYAARAQLRPVVYEGSTPLGQLNLTTEVENYPSWPAADSEALALFSRSAIPADRYGNYLSHIYEGKHAHHGKRSPTGPELMEWCRQQAINSGARIESGDIARVDFRKRPFTLYPAYGDPVQARSVIIATGAYAKYLGLPSEERFKNRGVSACAVCDGALHRFRDKPLIVVGGGDTAVEEATYLTKYASEVHLVHRRDKLRAGATMAERAHKNPKIKFKWNRELEEVLGNEVEGVTGALLKSTQKDGSTEHLTVSGVFLGIGHSPNTAFLEGQVELDENGYVRWTKAGRTWTSVEGVFAAGDVADSYYRQAVTAAGTGCMAALDAERWLAEHGEE
jgi:thioredoxin reductase (NADPH)